jgi:tetratricopeptide (TPR) repeat protein
MTQKLIRVWNNTETMWNRVVDVEPSAIAFKERGMILLEMGKYDAAVEDFTRALENPLNVWKPYIYNLYAFRGESQRLAGRCDEAVKDFTAAIRMLPHPVYFRFRGAALMDCGKTSEAADDFKRAGDVVAPLSWYWSKVESQQ